MKTVEMKKANQTLSDYAKNLKKEPVIFTKSGKPVAALVSLQNADMETVSLASNPKFLAIIERSSARRKANGGITADEMRRRLKKQNYGK